mmetsp:Transcript_26308/g.40147  ORF Transcript_26308/g.40147 Transcript_26308/m.40147 type:complete len:145 (+) Transcript_26308:480-914(+)|eukprot:CAMPEP_0170490702 /NCGR_PEP_ID=MMETSP0208-20121228/8808_1 /TAXON_ID=197538 /ORGANISM="Strombidium inclinatum, Strain S3" /LENGTH=144 /DNA_ID=CAMNT_0010766143 /DNA_START=1073 /DNA_END=1507 /DNA_ORIENTATION=-
MNLNVFSEDISPLRKKKTLLDLKDGTRTGGFASSGNISINKERLLQNWISEELNKFGVRHDKVSELKKQNEHQHSDSGLFDLVKPKFLAHQPPGSSSSYTNNVFSRPNEPSSKMVQVIDMQGENLSQDNSYKAIPKPKSQVFSA